MKKLIFLSILTYLISQTSISQEYGWKDISSNLPDFPGDTILRNLSDVFFVNDNEGWITSNKYGDDISYILHTTDGGETFELQTTLYSTHAIHMLNENVGYAGGASGLVYRTANGGENWIAIGSMSATLADISFPPMGDTGYCCGINGNIHSIDSSGVTKMISNVNGHLNSISFPVTSEEGWVCGGSVIRHYKNSVWNGDQDMPSGGYNAIYMVDTLKGWSVGDGGVIIHTEDGENWFEQTNPSPNQHSFFGLFFLDENNGWAIGSGGTIIHTNNGGVNWIVVGVGITSNPFTGVHFTSTTNGYVVGPGKTLLKYGETLSIGDEIQAIAFELFPNPTKDNLQIRCSDLKTENGKIEILSIDGKIILTKELNKGNDNIEINVSQLESEMYFCKITIDNKTSTKKIIIE